MKNIWYNNICSLDNIDEQNKMMRNGVIGSTADSDSVSRGSSPFSVVPWQGRRILRLSEMSGQYIGVWLSLVERYVRDVEVAGSNPVTPMELMNTTKLEIQVLWYFFVPNYFLENQKAYYSYLLNRK